MGTLLRKETTDMITLSSVSTDETSGWVLIVVAIIVFIILAKTVVKHYKKAKLNNPPDADASIILEDIKETIESLFSVERFKTLIEQSIEAALDTLVKGSTKEQLIETIKDNICDAISNYIVNEYPKYNIICSRDNIEKLADIVLDNFGFSSNKLDELYNNQIDKLNSADTY